MSEAEPISLRDEITAALASAGANPRHALGQNFMVDRSALNALLDNIAAKPGLRVVEVGPGTGVLTRRMLAAGATVLAVEFDSVLADLLERDLGETALQLVRGDALASKTALNPAIEAFAAQGPWVLGANLPYDIAIPLILNCLCLPNPPERCVVTVQWECAKRLCSASGSRDWGASAAVCQTAASGRIVRKLPPRCFYPRPRVDSAVLALAVHGSVPAGFSNWCRGVFAYRRKQLTRALRDHGLTRDAAHAAVARAGLALERRIEELSVAELQALFGATQESDDV
ncbi:MAG: 16S rRNA (adenine(1518)-N(6)/adenine(1519)-N(6))-dimethyltransferase RsmA [Planctomycetota bacterium]|jgi:16S rRNA (adenine1518-N6/adenine1519-N6)-dimethyltransferase|nr:16S rRNA (adenine(1518)-N(6)/adenine(1519)-N(6))-dimethyltransferase RsmA [Planctomycetota bacterium]